MLFIKTPCFLVIETIDSSVGAHYTSKAGKVYNGFTHLINRSSAYVSIVYNKGPLFFHALRRAMGNEKFNTFLRTYYQQHRYGVARPEGLLAAAQTVLDKPTVQRLYDEWIKGTHRP